MSAKGMSEAEVISSLKDLGVREPEKKFRDAMSPAVVFPAPQQGRSVRAQQVEEKISPEPASARPPRPQASEPPEAVEITPPAEVMEKEPASKSVAAAKESPSSSGDKLDDAIALLKALQEINKKILETNRDILLRLR